MSREINQAALGKFAEAVNTGNFDIFEQVVAPNCVDHDPAAGQVAGPSGYRTFFSGMRAAFPDMSVALETMVADEDSIAFAYTRPLLIRSGPAPATGTPSAPDSSLYP